MCDHVTLKISTECAGPGYAEKLQEICSRTIISIYSKGNKKLDNLDAKDQALLNQRMFM